MPTESYSAGLTSVLGAWRKHNPVESIPEAEMKRYGATPSCGNCIWNHGRPSCDNLLADNFWDRYFLEHPGVGEVDGKSAAKICPEYVWNETEKNVSASPIRFERIA